MGTVIQVVTAQGKRLVAILTIMFVNCTNRIVPLLVNRYLAQNIFLLIIGIFNPKVQVEQVNGTQANKGEFIFLVKAGFNFKLDVVKCRQKRKFQRTKQQFEIRPSG